MKMLSISLALLILLAGCERPLKYQIENPEPGFTWSDKLELPGFNEVRFVGGANVRIPEGYIDLRAHPPKDTTTVYYGYFYYTTEPGFESVYIGQWSRKRPNGFGGYYSRSTQYIGEWKDGKYHGEGEKLSSISRYKGRWFNGKRHGKGIQYGYKGRKVYEGYWRYDKREGHGIAYEEYSQIEKAIKYSGGWKQDKYHGEGVLYEYPTINENRYVGRWRYGEFHGTITNYLVANNDTTIRVYDNGEYVRTIRERKPYNPNSN